MRAHLEFTLGNEARDENDAIRGVCLAEPPCALRKRSFSSWNATWSFKLAGMSK